MNFFIAMKPPTTTAQMKRVRIVNHRPVFYDPPAVKAARNTLTAHLAAQKPAAPMTGPVSLRVIWLFPKGRTHKNGQWRVTRPDTDNLQKLLKDVMTQQGFWKDDALVASEITEKFWAKIPGIYIRIEEL